MYVQGDCAGVNTRAGELFNITDGSLANVIDFRALDTLNGLSAIISGGVSFTASTQDPGQSPYVANVSAKAAASFAANNFNYVKNAGAADSNFTIPMPVSPNILTLGNLPGIGNFQLYGHIQQIGYWPTTATVAQLQVLTT